MAGRKTINIKPTGGTSGAGRGGGITGFWDGELVQVLGKKYAGGSVLVAGKIIMSQAVSLAAVDTGRLRGSITVQTKTHSIFNEDRSEAEAGDIIQKPQQENTAHVGTDLEYGIYQEFGTGKMAAQPYLRPAFDLSRGKSLNAVTKLGKTILVDYLFRPGTGKSGPSGGGR